MTTTVRAVTPSGTDREQIDTLSAKLAEKAVNTPILVMTDERWRGPSYICVEEFMTVDLSWAEAFNVHFDLDSDGNPKYHAVSDIAIMERDFLHAEILEPIIKQALLRLTDDDLMYLKLLKERK